MDSRDLLSRISDLEKTMPEFRALESKVKSQKAAVAKAQIEQALSNSDRVSPDELSRHLNNYLMAW
ncbi:MULTISPECIES: hypothetical protein [Pseudomonas]|uniref:hypothetical protein n=1 Tax=Pseudomonas TaxID=286 RepID=UPI0014745CAE|nr:MULTISPECIES: hypothetical protein [Pseudomonas]NNA54542.1 hypothetical protein [Pseudomonas koreensis]